ncbi:TolC family protein [Parasediminibacterium paludis]|uniref:TolC family protein n=1 Tax=Parasediminibacterium paludis TaxID=908966 RepID=A0ABV8PTE4_9BACT
MNKYLIFLFLLSIGFNSKAQSNIDKYISLGLNNNQSIQQQNFELSKAMYALKEARTLYYPNVAFNTTYTLSQGGRVIGLPLGDLLNSAYATLNQLTASNNFPKLQNQNIQLNPNNFYDVKLRTTYPIFNPDIKYNYRIKDEQVNLQQLEVTLYKRELVKEIKTAFYQYIQSLKGVAIYKNANELVKENLRINNALFNNQKVNRNVVLRSEYEVRKIESAWIDANKNSQNAKAYFNFLINRPLSDSIITDEFTNIPSLENESSQDISKREELGKLSIVKEINANLIHLSNTYRLPKVSAMLDAGAQNFDFKINNHTPYFLFGLSVDWNLFAAGKNKYKVKEAEAALNSTIKQTDYVKSQIEVQLSTAINTYKASLKVYDNTLFQEKAALRNYNDLLKLYKEGQALYIELLDAQNQYITAQLQSSIALMDTWAKYAEVERANSSYPLN